MSDWKTLDLLTPEDQAKARESFKPDEIARIGDYEFSYYGPKLLRRVKPALTVGSVKSAAPKRSTKVKPMKAPPVLLIIGCGKEKADTTAGPVPARSLYTGPLFAARLAYAEAVQIPFMILSAKHGLVAPDHPLTSYDTTIEDLSEEERSDVQESVIREVIAFFGSEEAIAGKKIEIHGGAAYVELVEEVVVDFQPLIVAPPKGMGIGEQLAYYKDALAQLATPAPIAAAIVESGVERVIRVSLAEIVDSPLNPRTVYDPVKLQELADTMLGGVGIIQPLIVRRRPDGRYEIVAGHRRKRAGLLAGLVDAPVIVREMTDAQVLECHLIENLQRDDLSPLEEANGLSAALGLAEPDGQMRFDRETLAKKIGKSVMHIGRMLSLLCLPEKAKEAINNGVIGPAIGYLIASVPSPQMRTRLTGEVLKGFDGSPMSKREVEAHIRREYVKQLRGAPFDKDDEKLVPVREVVGARIFGGACRDCPFNSANMPDAAAQKFHFCTLPACYLAKVEAHVLAIKEKALAQGAVVITGEKASQYLYHDGTPKAESGMVDLKSPPLPSETVGRKDAPKWEVMTDGETKVKPTVVIDGDGKAHWLAPRKLAIEAAKKNGFADVFTATVGANTKSTKNGGDGGQSAQRKADENAKKKLDSAVSVAGIDALTVEIGKRGIPTEAWPALFEIALFHSGGDALAYFINRRGLTDGDDREKIVRTYVRKLEPARLPALVVELLLSGWMKLKGADAPGFASLAKVYGLDMATIRGEVKARMGEKAKPKAKPKPDKPEPPIRELIADLAKKRGLKTLAAIDEIATKHCGKPYVSLQGPELTALCNAIKALPIPAATKKGKKQK